MKKYTRKKLTKESLESEKIQLFMTLELYLPKLKTYNDKEKRFKDFIANSTLSGLRYMLKMRRIYSQTYGNPEGETLDMSLY